MLQKQILLLYFSGSGSTKTMSEILKHKLEILKYQVDLVDIDITTNPNIISKVTIQPSFQQLSKNQYTMTSF